MSPIQSEQPLHDGRPQPPAQGEPRDILVIGAALGGLTALCRIVGGLPRRFEAAVLVALDTASQPAPTVLQILGNYSPIPVEYAHDRCVVRQGRMVLSPPGVDMRISQPGITILEARGVLSDAGPSVDRLFKSAAAVYGKRVIGVVLTGGSHDGTNGLTAIEAAGGVGVVQTPSDAVDADMPLSAIRGDHPDFCVTIDQMARLLVQLVAGNHPR
jgi:two-component system chemotaxis response regulator CheB